MDLSLVVQRLSGDTTQGRLDSLVEWYEVRSVERGVAHTVLVVLNVPRGTQHQPQKKVICDQ